MSLKLEPVSVTAVALPLFVIVQPVVPVTADRSMFLPDASIVAAEAEAALL